jgi:hypothetical protein
MKHADKIAARAAMKHASNDRYAYLVYAFVRGRSHASQEPRVSEHKLPGGYWFQRAWLEMFGPGRLPPSREEVDAWLDVPEERIKRFGPRVKKMRPSRSQAAE